MPPKKKTGGKKCKQVGGWFWEEKDPYFGGVVKTIKGALSNVKPSALADVAGNFIPGLSGISKGLKMVGMGHGQHGRRQRGHGQHGRGDGFLVPNSNSYGGIKF